MEDVLRGSLDRIIGGKFPPRTVCWLIDHSEVLEIRLAQLCGEPREMMLPDERSLKRALTKQRPNEFPLVFTPFEFEVTVGFSVFTPEPIPGDLGQRNFCTAHSKRMNGES